MTTTSQDNPRGQQAVDISIAFTTITAVIVSLRLYTRFFLVRYAGTEDYFIILAMLCSIGLTICIVYQARFGMGRHIVDIDPKDVEPSLKAFWASLMVYYLSLGLTKASILLQYRRVFAISKFRIACWCTMGVVVAYTIWTVTSSIFACIPVRAFWTKEPAKCINQFVMWFTNAGINILTDFTIILLPVPVIRSLNLAKRQKQALIGIFAVGGFVCLVSILRLQSLVAISNSTDPTYDNPPAATWSSVETNVGIICSCLPLLRPLLASCLPGIFSTNKRSTHNSRPGLYPTVGSSKRPQRSDTYVLEDTKTSHSWGSNETDKKDIQVVTDIQISVEGGSGSPSNWTTPSNKQKQQHNKRDGASSTETLVKDAGEIV